MIGKVLRTVLEFLYDDCKLQIKNTSVCLKRKIVKNVLFFRQEMKTISFYALHLQPNYKI